jgi:DNA-binding response OmpR family regulator
MRRVGLSIVEQDTKYGEQLVGYLANQGLQAVLVPDLATLFTLLQQHPPRLVVLGETGHGSSMLPVVRRLRDLSRVPCIVLSNEPDDTSHIVTLEAGADDFIERTLPMRAILARIRAVLRRSEWPPEMLTPMQSVPLPIAPAPSRGWRLQPQHRRLLRPDGMECDLTTAEFDLLRLLVEAGGVPVSRDDISATVFRRTFRAEDRTVDNLVLRLRRKLGEDQEKAIKTVRGAGYMFAGFADAQLLVA